VNKTRFCLTHSYFLCLSAPLVSEQQKQSLAEIADVLFFRGARLYRKLQLNLRCLDLVRKLEIFFLLGHKKMEEQLKKKERMAKS